MPELLLGHLALFSVSVFSVATFSMTYAEVEANL